MANFPTPARLVMLGGPNKSLKRHGWGTGHWLWGGEGRLQKGKIACYLTCDFLPSGYVLLECNLMGLLGCSDILDMLFRLGFVRLCVTVRIID